MGRASKSKVSVERSAKKSAKSKTKKRSTIKAKQTSTSRQAQTKSGRSKSVRVSVKTNQKNKVGGMDKSVEQPVLEESKSSLTPNGSEKRRPLSDKLMEALERRKTANPFALAPGENPLAMRRGRRGRKPKNPEDYIPSTGQEDENERDDTDFTGLEYDTGLKFSKDSDDNSLNFDRFEDFDEELNFDA